MSWLNWLWSLLPDKCQMTGCSRAGVRGNENRINGLIVCDYCHAKGGMMDIDTIKAQYPAEYINALGKRDMDNIRALISEVERLTPSLVREES